MVTNILNTQIVVSQTKTKNIYKLIYQNVLDCSKLIITEANSRMYLLSLVNVCVCVYHIITYSIIYNFIDINIFNTFFVNVVLSSETSF